MLRSAPFILLAAPAAAHTGAHVHPHDGASWLAVVGALAVIALAGGLVAARRRNRRRSVSSLTERINISHVCA